MAPWVGHGPQDFLGHLLYETYSLGSPKSAGFGSNKLLLLSRQKLSGYSNICHISHAQGAGKSITRRYNRNRAAR